MNNRALACFSAFLFSAAAGAAVAPYGAFEDGNLSRTRPRGWIADWLNRQREGLTGHPEALSYPYDSCLWAGTISRQGDHGKPWWRYEQTAYYTDGLLRLGLALGDQAMVDKASAGVEYTLAHASPDGYLGNPSLWDGKNYPLSPGRETWSMSVFFRAMKAQYEAKPDPRIPAALEKYYFAYDLETLAGDRNIVAVEGILWTYSKTGDKRLLELAEKMWEMSPRAYNMPKTLTHVYCDNDDPVFLHGVSR